ncbi:MAG: CpsB/CapC family capsule biosynthesis tyrosine phosphatase [Planctomycetota bacterium]
MFADTHCHLCAGLDDGPRNTDEVLEMCQIAWNEGIRSVAVTAHQNDTWPLTPEKIKHSSDELQKQLNAVGCELQLFPTGEVMVSADTISDWHSGKLLSYGDANQYLLIEYPHGLFLDLRAMITEFVDAGIQPVIAHAERQPELLHGNGTVEELIQLGAIIQISSPSVSQPHSKKDHKAVRDWVRRGIAHVIGSDAHSPRRRRPMMMAAYHQIKSWTNVETADRICIHQGHAVLTGQMFHIVPPQPKKKRSWFSV